MHSILGFIALVLFIVAMVLFFTAFIKSKRSDEAEVSSSLIESPLVRASIGLIVTTLIILFIRQYT